MSLRLIKNPCSITGEEIDPECVCTECGKAFAPAGFNAGRKLCLQCTEKKEGIRCPLCQEEVSVEWDECPVCESPLGHKKQGTCCPACQVAVKPHWTKCPSCKTRLTGAESSQKAALKRLFSKVDLHDQPLHDLAYFQEPVGPLCFSPMGGFLASAHKANAQLWSTGSGKCVAPIGGQHTGQINAICFDSQGRWVFSAAHGETIMVYDVNSLEKKLCLLTGVGTHPVALALVEDSKTLLVAATHQEIYFFNNIEKRFQGQNEEAEPSFVFKDFDSHDGLLSVFWSAENQIFVVVSKNGRVFHLKKEPTTIVESKKLDISYIASSLLFGDFLWLLGAKKIAGEECTVVSCYDVSLECQQDLVFDSDLYGKPKELASDGGDVFLLTTTCLLAVRGGKFEQVHLHRANELIGDLFHSLALHQHFVAIGTESGRCFLWRGGKLSGRSIDQLGMVTQWNQNVLKNQRWVSRSEANSVLWDTDSIRPLGKAPHLKRNLRSAYPSFDCSGTRFVNYDNNIYDVATGETISTLERPENLDLNLELQARGFSPTGKQVWGVPWAMKILFPFGDAFSGNYRLFLWSLQGELVAEKTIEKCRWASLDVSSLNTWLHDVLLLERRGEILQLNGEDLEIAQVFEAPFPVEKCVITPSAFISADQKGIVRVYRDGEQVDYFSPVNSQVSALGCSRNAQVVVVESFPEKKRHAFEIEVFQVGSKENLLSSFSERFPGLVTGAWVDPSGDRLLVAYGAWNSSEQFLGLYDLESTDLVWASRFIERPIISAVMFSPDRFAVSLSNRLAFFSLADDDFDFSSVSGEAFLYSTEDDGVSRVVGREFPWVDITFSERTKSLF